MRLILASNSPRRRELLEKAGIEFEIRPSDVAEVRLPGEARIAFVRRLAGEKALKVAAEAPTGSLVLGADTDVVVEGEILGKPADAEDAARMLRRLGGRRHQVLTGVALVEAPDSVQAVDHASTHVWFRRLSEDEILDYVAGGEPLDKAGAYAIQGAASKFVIRVKGSYDNVIGLPVALVEKMLKRASETGAAMG